MSSGLFSAPRKVTLIFYSVDPLLYDQNIFVLFLVFFFFLRQDVMKPDFKIKLFFASGSEERSGSEVQCLAWDHGVSGIEPHRRRCVVSLGKTVYPLLNTFVNTRRTVPSSLKNCLGRKETSQNKPNPSISFLRFLLYSAWNCMTHRFR